MVVIIGGGITGLAAAHELGRRGVPFMLLEASHRLGGLIRTERAAGFTLDAGPDSLLVQKPAAIALCEELGLGSRLIATTRPRTAFVLKRGRLYPLPSPSMLGLPASAGALWRYDLMGWRARARLALEPIVPRGSADDESVAAFFRRRFGQASVDLIAEPLLGAIHAGDVETLSMPSLFPRLVEAERKPGKVLRNVRQPGPAQGSGLFRALRSGMAEMVERIVAGLPPESVLVNMAVERIGQAAGGWWRVTAGSRTIDAAAAIVTAPAHAAARIVAPADAAAARLWSAVPYVSTVSVALGWRRGDVPHPLAGSGFVVARRYNALRITACTWVSSKWEGRAPADHVLLRAFIGGARDPQAVDLSDAALASIAVGDLSATLHITAPPVLVRVFRARNAGAQHVVGHRARTAALAARLRALPGLFAAGSGFESIGIPDCVADGRRAGSAAADYVASRRVT